MLGIYLFYFIFSIKQNRPSVLCLTVADVNGDPEYLIPSFFFA